MNSFQFPHNWCWGQESSSSCLFASLLIVLFSGNKITSHQCWISIFGSLTAWVWSAYLIKLHYIYFFRFKICFFWTSYGLYAFQKYLLLHEDPSNSFGAFCNFLSVLNNYLLISRMRYLAKIQAHCLISHLWVASPLIAAAATPTIVTVHHWKILHKPLPAFQSTIQ